MVDNADLKAKGQSSSNDLFSSREVLRRESLLIEGIRADMKNAVDVFVAGVGIDLGFESIEIWFNNWDERLSKIKRDLIHLDIPNKDILLDVELSLNEILKKIKSDLKLVAKVRKNIINICIMIGLNEDKTNEFVKKSMKSIYHGLGISNAEEIKIMIVKINLDIKSWLGLLETIYKKIIKEIKFFDEPLQKVDQMNSFLAYLNEICTKMESTRKGLEGKNISFIMVENYLNEWAGLLEEIKNFLIVEDRSLPKLMLELIQKIQNSFKNAIALMQNKRLSLNQVIELMGSWRKELLKLEFNLNNYKSRLAA